MSHSCLRCPSTARRPWALTRRAERRQAEERGGGRGAPWSPCWACSWVRGGFPEPRGPYRVSDFTDSAVREISALLLLQPQVHPDSPS